MNGSRPPEPFSRAAAPGAAAPGAAAQRHSEQLTNLLRSRIMQQGALPFAQYMASVLYEPGLGYYSAGSTKLGPAGDFTTAPESSDLFGSCLARQFSQLCQGQGGAGFSVLELGAGTGALAEAFLQQLTADGELLPHYCILEPSADLRQRQQRRLQTGVAAHLSAHVQWLAELPRAFRGLIIANEVADAIPTERVRVEAQGLSQQIVTVGAEGLQLGWRPAPDGLARRWQQLTSDLPWELPPGYVTEVNELLPPWIGELAGTLEQGVFVLVDYGYPRREYYLPERSDGTLMCYYRHRAHPDPLWWPGLQDLTAHVDFTTVVESGCAAGLQLEGYASQGSFLLGNDLLELAASRDQAATASEPKQLLDKNATLLEQQKQQWQTSLEVQQLAGPGTMGERFGVMALSRNMGITLQGFLQQDLSHRL